MLLKEVNNILNINKDEWRNLSNYGIGDILTIKYQYVGLGLKIRTFTGICIKKVNSSITSSIRLRNVIGDIGIEMQFCVNSNRILDIKKVNVSKKTIKRSKLYYLRKQSLSKSKVVY